MTELQAAILAIEARHYAHPGIKERHIMAELGITATRYYQILNSLLDHPEAERVAPMLVKRLRRVREIRRGVRAAR